MNRLKTYDLYTIHDWDIMVCLTLDRKFYELLSVVLFYVHSRRNFISDYCVSILPECSQEYDSVDVDSPTFVQSLPSLPSSGIHLRRNSSSSNSSSNSSNSSETSKEGDDLLRRVGEGSRPSLAPALAELGSSRTMLLAASDSDLSMVGEVDEEGGRGRCAVPRRYHHQRHKTPGSSERLSVGSVSSTSFMSAVSSQEDVALVDLHVHLAKPIIECPLLLPSYRFVAILQVFSAVLQVFCRLTGLLPSYRFVAVLHVCCRLTGLLGVGLMLLDCSLVLVGCTLSHKLCISISLIRRGYYHQ